jgi:hypothetical protein
VALFERHLVVQIHSMLDLRAESDIVLVLGEYMAPMSHKVLYKLELAGRQVIFVDVDLSQNVFLLVRRQVLQNRNVDGLHAAEKRPWVDCDRLC